MGKVIIDRRLHRLTTDGVCWVFIVRAAGTTTTATVTGIAYRRVDSHRGMRFRAIRACFARGKFTNSYREARLRQTRLWMQPKYCLAGLLQL